MPAGAPVGEPPGAPPHGFLRRSARAAGRMYPCSPHANAAPACTDIRAPISHRYRDGVPPCERGAPARSPIDRTGGDSRCGRFRRPPPIPVHGPAPASHRRCRTAFSPRSGRKRDRPAGCREFRPGRTARRVPRWPRPTPSGRRRHSGGRRTSPAGRPVPHRVSRPWDGAGRRPGRPEAPARPGRRTAGRRARPPRGTAGTAASARR